MTKPQATKLKGELRETGRKTSDELRKDLRVPSVLYGPKVKENIHFHISELELEKILSRSQTKLQELSIDGQTYNTLLKRVEFDPVTDRPVHADFYLFEESRPVSLTIPIRLSGTPIGVTDGGGRTYQALRTVRVKVIPAKIPAQFDVDITPLNIGDAIHVADLDMEGLTLLDDPTRTIVTVTPPKSDSVFATTADLDEEEIEEVETDAEAPAEEGERSKTDES